MKLAFYLKQLRVFYAVAVNEKMTKAAAELCLTQPAVSHSIKELEGALGCPLFLRVRKSLQLTKQGEILFNSCRKIFSELDKVENEIDLSKQNSSESFSFSATQTIVKYFLFDSLKSFVEQNPTTKLRIQSSSKKETLELIKNGEVDFGFITSPVPENMDNSLEFIELFTFTDQFIAADRFPLDTTKPLNWHTLSTLPIITLGKNSLTHRYQKELMAKAGYELKTALECDNLDLVVEFTELGLGIGWVTDKVFSRVCQEGKRIKAINFESSFPLRSVVLVKNRYYPVSKAADRFLAFVAARGKKNE